MIQLFCISSQLHRESFLQKQTTQSIPNTLQTGNNNTWTMLNVWPWLWPEISIPQPLCSNSLLKVCAMLLKTLIFFNSYRANTKSCHEIFKVICWYKGGGRGTRTNKLYHGEHWRTCGPIREHTPTVIFIRLAMFLCSQQINIVYFAVFTPNLKSQGCILVFHNRYCNFYWSGLQ